MYYTSSVTQKGQVTIPKEIRDALDIRTNDKVAFVGDVVTNKYYIQVDPILSPEELLKKVKPSVKKNALDARDYAEINYSRN